MTPTKGPATLLVIAKEPVPGHAKTRLIGPYTPHDAATIAQAALSDTLDVVCASPARRRVLVLDGNPGPWVPPGVAVVPQAEGGLDERLAAAFDACDGPTLLIGMDTPQVTPRLLAPALTPDAWDSPYDAWFGAATDGGFWALGMAEPAPELVRGVAMSTPDTGAIQRQQLVGAGLRVHDLPRLRDVDTAQDADVVADATPGGRFATEVARLTRVGVGEHHRVDT